MGEQQNSCSSETMKNGQKSGGLETHVIHKERWSKNPCIS